MMEIIKYNRPNKHGICFHMKTARQDLLDNGPLYFFIYSVLCIFQQDTVCHCSIKITYFWLGQKTGMSIWFNVISMIKMTFLITISILQCVHFMSFFLREIIYRIFIREIIYYSNSHKCCIHIKIYVVKSIKLMKYFHLSSASIYLRMRITLHNKDNINESASIMLDYYNIKAS